MQDFSRARILRGGFFAFSWVTLNMALTFTNKYLYEYQDFKYPVFIILIGTAGTLVGVFIFMFIFRFDTGPKVTWDVVRQSWLLLLLLSFFHALTSALINESIVYISVSMSQLIKATSPGITLILSYLIEKHRASLAVILSVLLLILGAFLTVFNNPEFYGDNVYGHMFGLICAVVSEFAGAGQLVISAVLLQRVQLSSWNIIVVTSVPMVLFLVPVVWMYEWEGLRHVSMVWQVKVMLTFSMAGAFVYTVSNYFLIQYTSSVFTSVVANLKVVLLVLVSIVFFPAPLSGLNVAGMVISFAGFLLYNFLKLREKLAEGKQRKKVHQLNVNDDEAEGDEMEVMVVEEETSEEREREEARRRNTEPKEAQIV